MRLLDNWTDVLRRSWSVRFILIAAFLQGLEAALPLMGYALPIPDGWMAVILFVVTTLSFVARLIAQNNLEKRA